MCPALTESVCVTPEPPRVGSLPVAPSVRARKTMPQATGLPTAAALTRRRLSFGRAGCSVVDVADPRSALYVILFADADVFFLPATVAC